MENNKIISVLESLSLCVVACDICSVACLDEEDVSKMKTCIKLDLDCAEICGTTINLISRSSSFAKEILNLCIEICEACALECEKHAHMEHCKNCAERCKKCATECKQYLENN